MTHLKTTDFNLHLLVCLLSTISKLGWWKGVAFINLFKPPYFLKFYDMYTLKTHIKEYIYTYAFAFYVLILVYRFNGSIFLMYRHRDWYTLFICWPRHKTLSHLTFSSGNWVLEAANPSYAHRAWLAAAVPACSTHVGIALPPSVWVLLVPPPFWAGCSACQGGQSGTCMCSRGPGPTWLGRQEFPLTLGLCCHTPKPLGEAVKMALTHDIALTHTMTSRGCFQALPRALAFWNLHPQELLPGRRAVKRGVRELPVEQPQKETTELEFGVETKGTLYKESHAVCQSMSAFITQGESIGFQHTSLFFTQETLRGAKTKPEPGNGDRKIHHGVRWRRGPHGFVVSLENDYWESWGIHLQFVSVSAIHKPEVLIKMLLKEANQLTDTLQDGLFYLTHRRLLMSIMLPLSVIS